MKAMRPLLVVAIALTPPAALSESGILSPENFDRAAETIARIKALPEAELKLFYRRCARASVRGHLSNGEIALCSVGYEQLLQRHFGGNFRAFLEWRRGSDRGEARPAEPPLP